MATLQDLEDARAEFIKAFAAPPTVAARLSTALMQVYETDALKQPRATVIRAAQWAAAELNKVSLSTLETDAPGRIIARLEKRDCPLCADEDDGFGKPGAGGQVPVSPVTAGA